METYQRKYEDEEATNDEISQWKLAKEHTKLYKLNEGESRTL